MSASYYDAKMKKKQTVFVGLSGGVDSSVAALRLKKQGYNVVGVFIKVWHPDFMVCNWEQERLDAMRVAAHLEIPFLTCDAEEAYKTEVADYFIAEYKAGRTPNPDVMCNKAVKFGAFMKFAEAHGADYIATGHYAQKIDNQMYRGVDVGKDQTYFLWSLTQQQLDKVLFPVGDTPKEKIRKEAEKAKIPVADKQDSQGVCFLGHVDIPEFLSHYIDLKEGQVINTAGDIVGTHKGAFVYTIGQRHGFSLSKQTTSELPHYVVGKDVIKNVITVATDKPSISDPEDTKLTSLILREEIKVGDVLQAQFRYRQNPFTVCIVAISDGELQISVTEVVERPAVGQSCVLYKGSLCIGGGIIG